MWTEEEPDPERSHDLKALDFAKKSMDVWCHSILEDKRNYGLGLLVGWVLLFHARDCLMIPVYNICMLPFPSRNPVPPSV